MQTEVHVHGDNGMSELGSYLLSVSEANDLINLLKSADWFAVDSDNYQIKEVTVELDQNVITNIYTKKV